MSSRSFLIIALAGIFAIGLAFTLRSQLAGNQAQAALPQNVTRILVADETLSPGSFVRTKDLQWVEWPAQNLQESYILEGKMDAAQFSGAVVRRQLMKGEPITEALLVKANEGGFMAAVLGAGKRAISIAVDPTTGNAGFIFPGDKVDLILTHSIEIATPSNEGEDILASETFIEDVRVLAVDQQLDNPENTAILAKTVTLEVSKQQAEKINVAKDLGKISLSLRSLAAEEEKNEQIALQATRESDVSSVLTPHSATTMRRVIVIRGNERTELEFGN